jgi:hypothetical protein
MKREALKQEAGSLRRKARRRMPHASSFKLHAPNLTLQAESLKSKIWPDGTIKIFLSLLRRDVLMKKLCSH